MAYGFRHIPKRIPYGKIPRCENCGARTDIITAWNQPHICREVTYQSVPVLNFMPFETADLTQSDENCISP